jgi:hypothetical protein
VQKLEINSIVSGKGGLGKGGWGLLPPLQKIMPDIEYALIIN